MQWTAKISRLGHWGTRLIANIGQSGLMVLSALFYRHQALGGRKLWLQQIYHVGIKSLMIIVVSGLFVGMVLGLQGYYILVQYGSVDAVGQMVALTLCRELAPVVSALLFAGRAGSALTAEIGLMKTTEQLASMSMIGVDPIKHVLSPRLWAGLISLPILTIIFMVVGVYGGALVSVDWLGVYSGNFWSTMQHSVVFSHDIVQGLIKSLVFAMVITWIALYQGYESLPTSEGISRATTRTVVLSSLAVLGLDFILTILMFGNP